MPYFGIPIRNGLPIGLGTVAGLAGRAVAPSPPPPAGSFAVLPAAGTPTYTVTRTVLDSAGTSYAVPGAVLSSGGTSYSPI